MSALTDLQSAWQTEIEKISDPLYKAKAVYVLTQYVAALAAQTSSAGTDISSYSISGRSVTRRDGGAMSDLVLGIEFELRQLVYGNVTLADMNLNKTT